MATFNIDTTDANDETVEADYVEHADGHFRFMAYDSDFQSQLAVFIIREAYVRAIRKA